MMNVRVSVMFCGSVHSTVKDFMHKLLWEGFEHFESLDGFEFVLGSELWENDSSFFSKLSRLS